MTPFWALALPILWPVFGHQSFCVSSGSDLRLYPFRKALLKGIAAQNLQGLQPVRLMGPWVKLCTGVALAVSPRTQDNHGNTDGESGPGWTLSQMPADNGAGHCVLC